jgi:hypothetical protein
MFFHTDNGGVFLNSSGVGDLDSNFRGGEQMATTKTREQLYKEAKRLGIKGRSKMKKGALKAAVDRRTGH